MSISLLSKPARRFLSERLERLQQTLEGLGQRLRESIAAIVGSQFGEAIRDALEKVLQRESTRPSSWPKHREEHPYERDHPERRWYEEDENPDEAYWHDRVPPSSHESHDPEPQTTQPEPKPSRWKSLMSGLVQVVGCWLQHAPQRPSLRRFLGLGAVVGVATLFAGPVVGGVMMTVGTAVLMTRLSDETTSAIAMLANVTAR